MTNATPLNEKFLHDEKGRFIIGLPQDTNKNNTAGRPTKYEDWMVGEVYIYIEEMKEERKKNKKVLIGVEDFASRINIDDDTLVRWASKKVKDADGNPTKKLLHPDFYAAIKRLKSEQKKILIADGLYGGREVSSVMAIFLLKANHKMVETSNVDVTSKGQKIEQIPILGGNTNVPTDNGDKKASSTE